MSRIHPSPEQSELFGKLLSSNPAGQQADSSDQSTSFDKEKEAALHTLEDETPAAIPVDIPPSRTVHVPNLGLRPSPVIYLSVLDLCERFNVSKATIWRWTKSTPGFPQPIKLSPGTTRWRESEIQVFENGLERRA
ncbi:AlpA family phage regulatory protein [Hoeflea sp. CAU 1731]